MNKFPSYRGKSILIVDDAYFMRFLIKKTIAPLNFGEIREAENGKKALNLIKKYSFDIILMDIVMEEMDGLQALKQIFAKNENALVIVVSAIDTKKFLNYCIELGIADFVVKPFEKEDLIQSIINTIGDKS